MADDAEETPDGADEAAAEESDELVDEVTDEEAAGDDPAATEVPDDLSGFENLPPPPAEGLAGGGDPVAAERDEYRDALIRVKADFENYKKRIAKDHAATVERAAERLVTELLPVLDACDAATAHGAADVEPIAKSLGDILAREGLERLDPVGEPFDPNLHEAVLHEPADGDEDETLVVESLRVGYVWKGRVIRPAMVKVKG